ncbi:MAG: amino acid racemase [Acidobacteriaceae bacterium]
MKKIGIVGGVGWRSTVEYYTEICQRANAWHRARKLPGTPSTPEIVIESLDLARALALLGNDRDETSWRRFDEYNRSALLRLEAAGADVALIACNTLHHRFEAIARGVRIPVISILDATAKECARLGARQVLLLGTPLAMRSAKFREAFAKHGVELATPSGEVARGKTNTLIEELQRGRLKGAAVKVGRIVKASWPFEGDPAVCLACAELPLAFPGLSMQTCFKYAGVTYINTTAAHIDAVLAWVGIG